jgi:hypothetical protein
MPDIGVGQNGWQADIYQTPSGDIATVDGTLLGTQRVIRRLLTPRYDLLFHPNYGLGIPRRIGATTNVRTLTGLARAQMFQEAAVAQDPPPQVKILGRPDGTDIISVTYTDVESGGAMQLTFDTNVQPPTTNS